jgi:hypothetical protein
VEDRAALQRFNKAHGSLTNLVIVRHAFAGAETAIRPSRELTLFALGGSAHRSFSASQIMALSFVHLRRCPGPYIAKPHAKLLRKIASEDFPSAEYIPFAADSFGPIYRSLIKGVPTTHRNLHVRSDSHDRYRSLTPRDFQLGVRRSDQNHFASLFWPTQLGLVKPRAR